LISRETVGLHSPMASRQALGLSPCSGVDLLWVAIRVGRDRHALKTRHCSPANFVEVTPGALLQLRNTLPAAGDYASANASGGSSGYRTGQKWRGSDFVASLPRVVSPASPAWASAVASEGAVFKVGQDLIVAAEDRGADAQVPVSFGGNNMKWLALECAMLKVV
jgi:hypothetical protein